MREFLARVGCACRGLCERWNRWYQGSIERQRHVVEQDALRLGGHVVWHDKRGLNA